MNQIEALKQAKAWFERNTYGDEAVEEYEALVQAIEQAEQAQPVVWVKQILSEFPLLDDEGLDEEKHHCEWTLQQDRKRLHAMLNTAPSHRQPEPLTPEQVNLLINGRGDEGDDDYVEPTGDGFGLTDADLVRLVRRAEAHHGITKDQS